MAVFLHETRETIDLLRRVVDKLDENDGRIRAAELWDGVQCEPANIRSSDPTVARHGIRQMEALLDGLQSFASSLASTYKSHISLTRSRARIPYLTVQNLPTEIIHHIVKDTFDPSRPRSLFKYSHICSRIRNIILDSPSLWASIPLMLNMPTNLIQTITRRSAALGLTVNIHITGDRESDFYTVCKQSVHSSTVLSRLSTMFKHHHRWREVILKVNTQSTKFIQEHFPRANLSSVRVLRLNGFTTNFIREWQIPPLEELDWCIREGFPPSGIDTQMLHACLLWIGPNSSNLMNIATFLNAATGLRTLKLHLNLSVDDGHVKFPEARLSCLEHLKVTFAYLTGIGTTAHLLKAILCPGLKHLSLGTGSYADYSDLTEDMRSRYPLLTSFTLVIGWQTEDYCFEDILCSLPSTIKHLKIDMAFGYCGKFYASRKDNVVPHNNCISYSNLTSLDLFSKNYGILEKNFYADLSEILRRFRVSLTHFRPSVRKMMNKIEMELEERNAISTLQRSGVLADLTSTS